MSTLPLQHANGTAERLSASAPLSVTTAEATLTDTSAFQQGDRVDTTLVTHGMLVSLTDIPSRKHDVTHCGTRPWGNARTKGRARDTQTVAIILPR